MSGIYLVIRPGDKWHLAWTAGPLTRPQSLATCVLAAANFGANQRPRVDPFPVPVWRVEDDELPGTWDGSVDREGHWNRGGCAP